MVGEFCQGTKLTNLDPQELWELMHVASECYLKRMVAFLN